MPLESWGWRITPEELQSWIVKEDLNLVVINKPGLVLCHPSKQGEWSSLVGAVRAHCGLEQVHMPFRLDRETSGLVLFAKSHEFGRKLHRLVQNRLVSKTYVAILQGELERPVEVNEPIGTVEGSIVHVRQGVLTRPNGREAETLFTPLRCSRGYTLAMVRPRTGRLHQIRVHAEWMGFPLVGDKIYGSDGSLFLDFLERGWTPLHEERLHLHRHALHALHVEFRTVEGGAANDLRFTAPLAKDLEEFLFERMSLAPQDYRLLG